MSVFAVACIQINSGEDMDANVSKALRYAADAADAGADLILMPENVARMTWGPDAVQAGCFDEAAHPALIAFKDFAKKRNVWLHCGTVAVPAASGKAHNRTFVIDPTGQVSGVYDKIHMFDADLSKDETYAESATYEAGTKAVAVDIPWGRLGLTVCYDVRFPNLYKALADAGVDFFAVPSAFTKQTGQVHWQALLQARAIENGCFVFAPAQVGQHAGGRETYGHSLIIDPWGTILADAGEDEGFILADLDPMDIDVARGKIPSLKHARDIGDVEVQYCPRY
jgi:predicted amidohydrolase